MFIYLWLRPKNFFDEKVCARNYEAFVVLGQKFYSKNRNEKPCGCKLFFFFERIQDGFKAFSLNLGVDGALKSKHKSLLIEFDLWCVFTNTNLHEMHNDRLWRNIICRMNNAKRDAIKSSNSRIASLANVSSKIRCEHGETQNNFVGTRLSDV